MSPVAPRPIDECVGRLLSAAAADAVVSSGSFSFEKCISSRKDKKKTKQKEEK